MKLEKNKTFESQEFNVLVWLVKKKHNKKAFNQIFCSLDNWMQLEIRKINFKFPYIPFKVADAMIYRISSLYISCLKYDFSSPIPFKFFAIQQLKWLMYGEHRFFITNKYKIVNFSSEYNENTYFGDIISAKKSQNGLYLQEKLNNNNYLNEFNGIRRKIFKLKMDGYKNQEIATKLLLSYKKIDNELLQIKKKIRSAFVL